MVGLSRVGFEGWPSTSELRSCFCLSTLLTRGKFKMRYYSTVVVSGGACELSGFTPRARFGVSLRIAKTSTHTNYAPGMPSEPQGAALEVCRVW